MTSWGLGMSYTGTERRSHIKMVNESKEFEEHILITSVRNLCMITVSID